MSNKMVLGVLLGIGALAFIAYKAGAFQQSGSSKEKTKKTPYYHPPPLPTPSPPGPPTGGPGKTPGRPPVLPQ